LTNYKSIALAAATLIGALGLASPSWAEDAGQKPAPVGEAIKKGAEDTGAAIGKAAKDVGASIQSKVEPASETVKQKAQDTGEKIESGAKETGGFLDRTTKNFREGASSFFQKVGNFFSGK